MPNNWQDSHSRMQEQEYEDVRFVDDFSDDDEGFNEGIEQSGNELLSQGNGDDISDNGLEDFDDDHIYEDHEENEELNDGEYNLDEDEEVGDIDLHPPADTLASRIGDHDLDAAASRLLRQLAPGFRVATGEPDNEEDSDSASSEASNLRRITQMPTLRSLLGEAMHGTFSNPRSEQIVAALRSGDESSIIGGLTDLNEMLLIPQHGIFGLSMIPVDAFSKALITVLAESHSIEVQVMTARAISQLIDNNPGSSTVRCFIHAGLVPIMRKIFENVFYIDLIEQLIHVLKPVASVEPRLVLVSGCINPCISTLDFFNEHIQREIMASIEACTKVIDSQTFDEACNMFSLFPEHPNDLIIGAYSSLLTGIVRCENQDIEGVVKPKVWEVLLSFIHSGSPYLSRLMRAAAHVATRCPSYVGDIAGVASLVFNAIIPAGEDQTEDIYSRMINVPKDILFGALKLLRVMLPFPKPLDSFVGPYRRQNHNPGAPTGSVVEFARRAVQLATCAYSVTTNASVRQLSILVVLQVVDTLKSQDMDSLFQIVDALKLVGFAADVVAEGKQSLALTVGGLDIVFELASHPEILSIIHDSGLICDLQQHVTPDIPVQVPHGQFGLGDDLAPVASYMSSLLMNILNDPEIRSPDSTSDIVESIFQGEFDLKTLRSAPLPNLIHAGMLEALNSHDIRSLLSEDVVLMMQSAVNRLEKLELELTGSRATSLEDVISRIVYVRIVDKNNARSDRSWSATVPAFATLESIEQFVRSRLQLLETVVTNEDSDTAEHRYTPDSNVIFYANNVRLPQDISVLKAIAGQLGTPVLMYEITAEEEAELEISKPPEPSINGHLLTALEILRKLASENELRGELISWEKFRSAKLTAKLSRQLADILAVSTSMLPQWTFDTVHKYPFLYPLKLRLHFVQLTSFGMGRNLRLLRRMHQENFDQEDHHMPDDEDSSHILGRHKRQKFRISRDNLLESGLQLLEHSSQSPAIIEVMFTGEEGTGKGPTQEFFALASKALSELNSGMWISTANGLYPRSDLEPSKKILRGFKGVGILVARALLDKRILDFQLNTAFFEAILSDTGPSLSKLRRVDLELAKSLEKILDSSPKDIGSMNLDFTMPGTNVELLPSGVDIDVTSENASDYVQLICDRIVGSGIRLQIESFRSGFSTTIPVSTLKSFMLDELATLCGADRAEDWSYATLQDAFNADHGYNMNSTPVQQLISTLNEFGPAERRKFLIFATGSPHLPVGGFKALQPPFTVVVKHPDNESLDNDQYLPSVMTCANYFKLPVYSSKEIMQSQLLVAMNEGCGSFPLS